MQDVILRAQADADVHVVAPSTATTFTPRTRQTEMPTGIAVMQRARCRITWFGGGAAGSNGGCYVVGWEWKGGVWTPFPLLFTSDGVKLGGPAGLAGDVPSDAHTFARSIADVSGLDLQVVNPDVDGAIAAAAFSTLGFSYIDPQPFRGTCESLGALVAFN